MTFLAEHDSLLTVDEIQLGGDRVVRAIKQLVDVDTRPGRFLLSGSTNFLTVPTISESLAGRVRILGLWPLSEAELVGRPPRAFDRWFDQPVRFDPGEPTERRQYLEILCRGGYPEVVRLDDPLLRDDWYDSYIETVTRCDLFELADIRRKATFPSLLRWAAAATGSEINVTTAANALGIDRSTVVSYLGWLRTVFLIHELPPWSRNFTSRAVRRSKLHVTDTGLAANLLGIGPAKLAPATAPATGALLETFTVNEISRSAGRLGQSCGYVPLPGPSATPDRPGSGTARRRGGCRRGQGHQLPHRRPPAPCPLAPGQAQQCRPWNVPGGSPAPHRTALSHGRRPAPSASHQHTLVGTP